MGRDDEGCGHGRLRSRSCRVSADGRGCARFERLYKRIERSIKSGGRRRLTRQANTRGAILEAAEELFAERGFGAVSLREIARTAGANAGSLVYHFGDKTALLREIYGARSAAMNARRMELLHEATRVEGRDRRIEAILRAYLIPAFDGPDAGGARFTRLRAVLSAEGNAEAAAIIAETFDATSHAFIDALHACVPGAAREAIVWRSQFLLGSLYYTLVNPDRLERLSGGAIDAGDREAAIDAIVHATADAVRGAARPNGAGKRHLREEISA